MAIGSKMSPGVKDRLGELAKNNDGGKNEIISIDEEEPDVPPLLKEVFQMVYEIRNLISNIKENTKKIKEIVQTSNNFQNKDAFQEIETRIKDTYNIAFKITNELKQLDVKPNKKDEDENSDKSVLARVKRIQYGSLRQDFQNALFESNEFMEKYREQKRSLLKKQAALVHATLDDEELERLLDDPDTINLFTDNILLDSRIARDELSQIEERHAELLKIEDMLTTVNGQFKQIAILIDNQKDHVNRIEYHACDAINYVDKGMINLQKAEKNRKKAKKMLYLTIICVLLIVILLLIILLDK